MAASTQPYSAYATDSQGQPYNNSPMYTVHSARLNIKIYNLHPSPDTGPDPTCDLPAGPYYTLPSAVSPTHTHVQHSLTAIHSTLTHKRSGLTPWEGQIPHVPRCPTLPTTLNSVTEPASCTPLFATVMTSFCKPVIHAVSASEPQTHPARKLAGDPRDLHGIGNTVHCHMR
jgi:hypothetical protein